MARLGPISRAELARALRDLGFEGPNSGGKHGFMVSGEITVAIPTLTKATSVENCSRESSGTRARLGRNGSTCDRCLIDA